MLFRSYGCSGSKQNSEGYDPKARGDVAHSGNHENTSSVLLHEGVQDRAVCVGRLERCPQFATHTFRGLSVVVSAFEQDLATTLRTHRSWFGIAGAHQSVSEIMVPSVATVAAGGTQERQDRDHKEQDQPGE